MEFRKKSINNLLYSALGQLITVAFGLILPRLWVVSYGSEVNGLLSSLSQFLVYLGLFEAGIGTATLQALYKPVAEDNWDDINGVLAASKVYYRQTGRSYFVGLLIMSAVYPLIAKSSLPYFTVAGAVLFSGLGNVVLFYFQGKYVYFLHAEGKNYITVNLGTVITIVNSLAKVIMIYLDVNIVAILAVNFLVQCLQAVYIMCYMRRYKKLDLNVDPNYESVSQKNSILIHQVSGLVFQNTDVLILTMVCDLRVVSVYSMYKLIVTQLQNVLNIPINSIRFALGQTFQINREEYKKQIDIVESFNSAIHYALYAVALYLMLPFMRLYTAGVTDINYVDPWLAILFVAINLLDKSRTPMLLTIEYAGHFRKTIRQTVTESALNLVVSLIGVYFLGIYGVLIGTVTALAYRTNEIILYSNHKILHRSAKKTYGIYLINIVLFVLTQLLFGIVICSTWIDSYLRFAAAGVVCSVLSLLIMCGGQLVFPDCRMIVKSFAAKALRK